MITTEPIVEYIVMVGLSQELNQYLLYLYNTSDKKKFMFKNYRNTHINLPINYVKVDYPIAFAL
jgi:hypothetical protein